MIKKIKTILAERQLRKKLSELERQKQFVNIEEARNIGVVFEHTSAEAFEVVKQFVLKLKEQGKRVHAIGYFDQKHPVAHLSYPKTEFDFFNTKETNGLQVPSSPYIQTFMGEVKDLLIDFNFKNKFPLRYIVAHSHAKCKVGLEFPGNLLTHDVLLALPEYPTLTEFIAQVNKYLRMIRK